MHIDKGHPDRTFEDNLQDDLKTLNFYLPKKRKQLKSLLQEKRPHVICGDGNAHYFRKKELEYLAGILNNTEQEVLLLPIIIEVGSQDDLLMVRSKTGIEAKIFSKILDMPVPVKTNMTLIVKPQLAVIRNVLKTATQYAFTA